VILTTEEPVMSAAVAVPLPAVPRLTTLRNLARARQEFHALEAWLMSDESCQLPLHEVEQAQERRGREIQRLLLEAHVAQRGPGDVGPAVEVGPAEGASVEVLHPHRRLDPCHPQTIFGEITVERTGYCRPGAATVHPLDDQLQLPHRSFSYELQRRLVQAAVQGPFDEATARVAEATGVMVPKRSAEQLVQEAAQDFEAFYQARTPPPGAATGPILVAALDGKGVPMVKAAPTTRVIRRGKGKAGIMAEVVQELRRRDPERQKHWVVLTDGERALQQTVKRRLRGVPLVLDFQHVLAKLWTAAYAFHEEGSPKALAWVQERAWRVLHGEVSLVVQGMRLSAIKRHLQGQKCKVVEAVAGYLYRNRRHMRYDEYLRQGWPIATGVVEGACKNLVKDRMERSGMRWTPLKAEAMLKLRAVYLSGDFKAYWKFHVTRDHERLHPPGSWRPFHTIEGK
jgi:hypothetical protein